MPPPSSSSVSWQCSLYWPVRRHRACRYRDESDWRQCWWDRDDTSPVECLYHDYRTDPSPWPSPTRCALNITSTHWHAATKSQWQLVGKRFTSIIHQNTTNSYFCSCLRLLSENFIRRRSFFFWWRTLIEIKTLTEERKLVVFWWIFNLKSQWRSV